MKEEIENSGICLRNTLPTFDKVLNIPRGTAFLLLFSGGGRGHTLLVLLFDRFKQRVEGLPVDKALDCLSKCGSVATKVQHLPTTEFSQHWCKLWIINVFAREARVTSYVYTKFPQSYDVAGRRDVGEVNLCIFQPWQGFQRLFSITV